MFNRFALCAHFLKLSHKTGSFFFFIDNVKQEFACEFTLALWGTAWVVYVLLIGVTFFLRKIIKHAGYLGLQVG